MPLPSLIEIIPLAAPVHAEITVPGSKSITNRALILAALANGLTTLNGALWSEDTQVMVECLDRLGFEVRVEPDSNQACNRTITVRGLGGKIPRGGTVDKPLELFVGNAGTAARFLAAMVCLGHGVYRLQGVPRMHERPQAALFTALRELGYSIESENDKLPVVIRGTGPRGGNCRVSVEESSQFASALLLGAHRGEWKVEVIGANEDELPYVEMTRKMVEAYGRSGGIFVVEPDASSGSYFWAAGYMEFTSYIEQKALDGCIHRTWSGNDTVKVASWPASGWQIDSQFPNLFRRVTNCSPAFEIEPKQHRGKRAEMHREFLAKTEANFRSAPAHIGSEKASSWFGPSLPLSRQTDLGDSIMTAIALAPLAVMPMRFIDLGRLRVQECERVVALRTELTKCGAKVVETEHLKTELISDASGRTKLGTKVLGIVDALDVFPSKLHGAEIETYNDHRMAMCFAILGLKVPGIKIKNPACVKKTFPNFFQKLAAAPPGGLGATILNGHTGEPLAHDELFAE